jgi:hypothetical protein
MGFELTAGRSGAQRRTRIRPIFDRLEAVLGLATLAFFATVVMLDEKDLEGQGADRAERAAAHRAIADTGAGEWFVGAYGGLPYTHNSEVVFTRPGGDGARAPGDLVAHDVAWSGRPFKSPIYYGIRAARWREASPFGGMLDFTHSKAISDREQTIRFSGDREGRRLGESAKVGDAFRHFEFSHGHNMLTLNGLLRLARLGPRIQPYIGGGVGVALPHTEIQFQSEPKRTYEYQYAGPVGQVLGGLEIRLPRVSLFIEYKLTLARYAAPLTGRDSRHGWGFDDFPAQLARWWRGERPEYGYAMTTLVSHQVIFGAGARAGAPTRAAP